VGEFGTRQMLDIILYHYNYHFASQQSLVFAVVMDVLWFWCSCKDLVSGWGHQRACYSPWLTGVSLVC